MMKVHTRTRILVCAYALVEKKYSSNFEMDYWRLGTVLWLARLSTPIAIIVGRRM